MPPVLELARRYSEALAALRAVHAFDDWLGEHWHDQCPPRPATASARSPVGIWGDVTWHESGDDVVGYLPDEDGCFRVAVSAELPEFWPAVPLIDAPRVDDDIVISTAMPSDHPPPTR